MIQNPSVRIVRSQNRRKTISARLTDGGTVIEVLSPANVTDEELAPIIERLRRRISRQLEKPPADDDAALVRRATELNRAYFGGELRWRDIRYVTNQQKRYGSCTPTTGEIRISHRVALMPAWVRDYVLVHELAHLREPNHGLRFWSLVNRYPKSERARGYLIAMGLETESGEPAEPDLA